MLSGLTRTFRWRAAVTIAVLYALCSLAPSLALAFVDAKTAVHCLTDDHHGSAKSGAQIHEHGDGILHSHGPDGASSTADADKDSGSPGQCCGIFCVTALTASLHFAIGAPVHAAVLAPTPQDRMDGRGPDRINRPPITLLS